MPNEWGAAVTSLDGAIGEMKRVFKEMAESRLNGDPVPTVESVELVTWVVKMAAGLLDVRMEDMHTSLPLAWFSQHSIDDSLAKLPQAIAMLQDEELMSSMFSKSDLRTPPLEVAIALTLIEVAVSVLRGVGRK